MSQNRRLYGAVEAGGTKFVCAIGDESGRILAEDRLATTDPDTTLAAVVERLRVWSAGAGPLAAIGCASFGPIELDQRSAVWGRILGTPKRGWGGTDIAGTLAQAFRCPVGFDTDVNAAAIAEHRWGAAQDVADSVYVTVGTGIGAGVLVGGRPLHGLLHPEVGHVYPRRHPLDQDFTGVCPYHGDCLEGLASGPAILARSGAPLERLDAVDRSWQIEADYLGQLCAQLVLMLSPQRIVLGGGVMSQTRLLPLIRGRLQHWLHGYIDRPQISAGIDEYVVAPGLGARAGIMGALALAVGAENAP